MINGQTFHWSRIICAGGNRILGGERLFKQWQDFYDPRLLWVKKGVTKLSVRYGPNSNNTWPMATLSGPAPTMPLVTPGVVSITELTGASSRSG